MFTRQRDVALLMRDRWGQVKRAVDLRFRRRAVRWHCHTAISTHPLRDVRAGARGRLADPLIVALFGLFLRVKLLEIPEEIVEAVRLWQMFVADAEWVLAKFPVR